VLNEGLKHGFQNWGNDHEPEIDINLANNITLIKGASGVQYGPEALGGAIIVNTNPLYLNEPLNVTIGSGFETNGREYYVKSQISQGLKRGSYFAGVNYNRSGDKHSPNYSLTNSGKEIITWMLK
jgi:iron complex outermembrane receptor protein